MDKQRIEEIMRSILEKQGKSTAFSDQDSLREIGFRSLDFSELALRIEQEQGKPLVFAAARLREIETVEDMIGFFHESTEAAQ